MSEDPPTSLPAMTDSHDITAEVPLEPRMEALLIVAEGGIPTPDFARLLDRPEETILLALQALADSYVVRGSGIRLRHTATGWRLFAAPEYHDLVREALGDDQPTRLTQAALETLAVVAYRQPVTRARIGSIRGVSVDAVVRTLVSRGLIVETGVESGSGAVLYATSELFLEKLGIESLAQLPALAEYLPALDTVIGSIDLTSI